MLRATLFRSRSQSMCIAPRRDHLHYGLLRPVLLGNFSMRPAPGVISHYD